MDVEQRYLERTVRWLAINVLAFRNRLLRILPEGGKGGPPGPRARMGEAKGAITSENNYRLARPPLVPSRLFLSPGFRVEKRPGTFSREMRKEWVKDIFITVQHFSS